MKLPVICNECTKNISDIVEINKHCRFVHVTDSMVYEHVCKFGHLEFCVLKHFPHEILFEIGAQAIEDGYYREAISSFSSSLERFYEFFIKVTCELEKIDSQEFKKSWKIISSLSERQLGAYSFRYLSYFGKAPNVLAGKAKELRNNVIHRGYIPSYNEAIDYGEIVLNEVIPVLLEMSSKDKVGFSEKCNNFLWKTYAQVLSKNPDCHVAQSDNPFVLSWNRLHLESSGTTISLATRLEQRPICYSVVNS